MNTPNTKTSKVPCPNCGTELIWDKQNSFRPFCSANCKNNDLVAWANEEHAIPGEPMEDVFSDDLERGI
ncbi:DNA gyrase inhibitor YacG [Zhongshania aliphaticivorans]|uniref:DNA gyrase inhibitor YacG n=1 Tax=Zhongshania aliphaticivorans TaxID=1470434 RepID=A0A5S9N3W6_9GAMM|nr:DNA gyrase inhibitor YacG [Zhongshania aliphaticivorans]CAA0083043.1 DNA gyrase inhibitor YacG [Zhongshania aliphaticivorans]CAA0083722.1 DNA gyrase inhibitor YacG [Zhongshania aliphaticivorans]